MKRRLKALPAGSFYTEPPGVDHFAMTEGEAVVIQITGTGPSGLTCVDPRNDPPESGPVAVESGIRGAPDEPTNLADLLRAPSGPAATYLSPAEPNGSDLAADGSLTGPANGRDSDAKPRRFSQRT